MVAIEKMGLLKMDFLGLTTLTILDDTLKLIAQTRGEHITLEGILLDDQETYEKVFHSGLTSGVFQFESHGMRDVLRRYRPNSIEDLTALNALYRPGPIQGGMIDDFIDRKHGRKRIEYELPELQEILQETLGVIVYQEQVMQIANRLAGYSLGEADLLRRAMGKKIAEEMAAQRERFVTGAVKNGYPPKKIEKIFDLMAQFAGYGFNKSHSAAYALLAYHTAYLKTHYPVEFMAALLTSVTGSTDDVVKYINECREMGIAVEPPDINVSDANFTPHGSAIRFGLAAVKNVGGNAIESIVAARRNLGKFESIFAICEKVEGLRALNTHEISAMKSSTGKDENITTAGMITNLRVLKSKKGDFYAQGSLEDMAGSIDMLVFPEAYRKLQEKVKLQVPVLIRGGVRIEEGANPKLTVNDILPLEEAKVPLPKSLRIRIQVENAEDVTVDQLHSLCRERKGEAKVLFDVERQGDFMVVMEAEDYNVQPDRNFIARVEELCGRGAVRIID